MLKKRGDLNKRALGGGEEVQSDMHLLKVESSNVEKIV